MSIKFKGCWLGASINSLGKNRIREIEKYFSLYDYGYDVSVLSEPEIEFCFFYYQRTLHSLLLTSVKLSQNLGKRLVVLYEDILDGEIQEKACVFDSVDINSPQFNLWCEHLSQQVAYHFQSHQDVLSLQQFSEDKNISKDLVEILKYIDKNLSRTIREEDVAEYCHYSTTYFSKFFHKTVGVSFRDYLIQKRINLAKQLLTEEKDEKISFIAFQCGYNDVSYFSRIFKKKTGVTPATYRQAH